MNEVPLPPLKSPSPSGPVSTPKAQKKCVMDVTCANPKRNNKNDKLKANDTHITEPPSRDIDVKTNEETAGTPTSNVEFVTL